MTYSERCSNDMSVLSFAAASDLDFISFPAADFLDPDIDILVDGSFLSEMKREARAGRGNKL